MGQKTHPEGFRRVLTKKWHSVWHAEGSFRAFLEEDLKIRKYLKDKIESAGIDELKISRSTNDVRIDISVARPGLVIGRGGAMSRMIKGDLEKMINGKVKFEVHEVERPNLSPVLAVESIVGAMERRYPYKRAINGTIRRVMEAGAKGIKIFVSGRLGGNSIARREKYSEGAIPTSTISENVSYADGFARTRKGTVGVKVWLTQPDEE